MKITDILPENRPIERFIKKTGEISEQQQNSIDSQLKSMLKIK